MAGIDVGGHGGKRSVNQEIPLVPFIDFLLCLVMFLLVTAVWSHMARLEADAKVPSPSKQMEEEPPKPQKKMTVEIKQDSFSVAWLLGGSSQPITSFTVARNDEAAKVDKNGNMLFKELAQKIAESYKDQGQHKDKSDKKFDQAIINAGNDTEFAVITAVIDAINAAKRDNPAAKGGGDPKDAKIPAFSISFQM